MPDTKQLIRLLRLRNWRSRQQVLERNIEAADALEQANEQAAIDKDFIQQYQLEIKQLKYRNECLEETLAGRFEDEELNAP